MVKPPTPADTLVPPPDAPPTAANPAELKLLRSRVSSLESEVSELRSGLVAVRREALQSRSGGDGYRLPRELLNSHQTLRGAIGVVADAIGYLGHDKGKAAILAAVNPPSTAATT